MRLDRQILTGFAAGVVAGFLSRVPSAGMLQKVLIDLEPVGTVFIRLISMVVVPLVVASVFVGVASLDGVRALGRVGGKTISYFLGTTLAAAIIGTIVALATHVGAGLSPTDRDALAGRLPAATASAPPSVAQVIVNMVPQNPFASAAQGGADLLPLIIAVCIFGAAATMTKTEGRRVVVHFFEGVNDISMVVIGWLMRLAPVAVFVLIAATVARSGTGVLDELLAFASVVLVALAAHLVLTLAPALVLGARVGVAKFVRSSSDAILLAFSTASSNATLPVSMSVARERLGIPGDIAGFVLPPGASLNKNGSAAYKAVTAVFIAHLYGVTLDPAAIAAIVLLSTVAAFAGAGVPGSSLVTTLIVLDGIGLGPRAAAGIALVAAVDRPLDMCRSMVNKISNLVGASWIARSELAASRVAEAAIDGVEAIAVEEEPA